MKTFYLGLVGATMAAMASHAAGDSKIEKIAQEVMEKDAMHSNVCPNIENLSLNERKQLYCIEKRDKFVYVLEIQNYSALAISDKEGNLLCMDLGMDGKCEEINFNGFKTPKVKYVSEIY